jgi:isocitrate dehydrogenase kinase/phosphatase
MTVSSAAAPRGAAPGPGPAATAAAAAARAGLTTPSIEQSYERLNTDVRGGAAASVAATADVILAIFDDFYRRLCEYPYEAKCAFETMDLPASIRISGERLQLYSRYIAQHGPRLRAAHPALADSPQVWDALDARFAAMIVERYEADIAFSFLHSLRRNIGQALWRPVAYSFPPPSPRRALSMASAYRRLPVDGSIDVQLLCTALQVAGFSVPFEDLQGDAQRILQRLGTLLGERVTPTPRPMARPTALDLVEAGFFRDRTAVLVARWLLDDGALLPFVIVLLNGPAGIRVDAVLHRTSDIHDLFSSALANFHVTTRLYYQTCVFLFSLMPLRPLGHHYSTIGFNHVGKVAILAEMIAQVRRAGQRLQRSPGTPGTVAIGFTCEACSYHLKIIRDRPTTAYKWGAYPGLAAVVDKYRAVHEINRASSMLDNVMYFNVRLEEGLFDPELLAQIRQQAGGSVQLDDAGLVVRSLIVQLKIVPLPVFLARASPSEVRAVIASLGHCIRNNAATNLFNKDLDSRNYGVGRYGRVFLFDYDAVEKLTDVKIHTNRDREPGEEVPPDWFFEQGTIFLPEELEVGMQFPNRFARQCFREVNGDLLQVEYWRGMQQRLLRGEFPELTVYPQSCRLV